MFVSCREFARDSPQVCKDEHYVADSSGDVISVPFSGETANGQVDEGILREQFLVVVELVVIILEPSKL